MDRSDDALDRARDVRQGEELPIESLFSYLSEQIEGFGDEPVLRQFPSGHSNLTYLIQDGEREYVLRRPPFGAQVKTGHDMRREWRILTALQGVWPRIPTPYVLCEDEDVIGAHFYVMERVQGVILRGPRPKQVELDEATMARICETFVQTFVEIHSIDLEAAGLDDFGRPEGYVQRQVEGWTRRYGKARTDDIPQMDEVAMWLAEHMPAESGVSLIHNDFKYDNIVLDPAELGQVRAVLDWEMATVGDPLMDLGTSLSYWVDPDDRMELQALAFGPTALPGNLRRQQLVERYAELSGRDVSEILFYYAYGLFKTAVVGQQIYYRFEQGHTQDPRFAMLIHAVKALAETAAYAIEHEHIGPAPS